MEKDAIISVRVKKSVKERAEKILNDNGFSLSNAINVYLTQIAKQGYPLLEMRREMRKNEPIDNTLFFEEIQKGVNEVVQNEAPYRDKIMKILLFGSYAKNQATPKSDVDLHVVSNGEMSLSELIDFETKLKKKLGKDIDTVGSSTIAQDDPFIDKIRDSEITLYEQKR